MSQGIAYPPETKAAVLAALMTGQSISQVAEEYHLPRGTVSRWRADLNTGVLEALQPEIKADIGELLIELLHENLTTLRAQARFFRREDWLVLQPASDLAVLYGVVTDKSVRLLEALQEPEPVEGGPGAPPA